MARKKPHEEHENHERYLVTYSDLITLLLAFFIILYALSSPDEAKFEQFSESLSVAFNQGTPSVIDFEGTFNKNARKEITQQELDEMKEIKEKYQLEETKVKIDRLIQEKALNGKISTKLDEDGLHIIVTNELLFASGEATLKKETKGIIGDITNMLVSLPNDISISGHTDNVPISTERFPSNWELSTARAITVLKEMMAQNERLVPERLSASGYGEHHPVATNATEDGKAKNRRVDILIERIGTNVPEQEVTE